MATYYSLDTIETTLICALGGLGAFKSAVWGVRGVFKVSVSDSWLPLRLQSDKLQT